ncbi:MAG: NAD(P) transhydrogenase subunit alpha [Deltaproteobacteria bacterium]|nr:NAD(P) transhydrogenase subunit alpha [Deltaproteobacteria bacterium]MCW5803872.1 NAD(P) transhydrogenase subunit alpha [Deltaproteobacteria bacterium]
MRIAVPKEIMAGERRVAATPDTVKKYRKLGHEVYVEAGAGAGIFVTDDAYREAGALVTRNVEEMLAAADLILKVKQPMLNATAGKHEVDMMSTGAMLVTFLHPASPESHDMVRKLRDRGITSFTMDGIPRITRAQAMDALTSMSTCTGYRAVLDAARHLPRFMPMIGTAIGTTKPAEVLVIGAGVVGLQALATAKRLGAVIHAWDIRAAARKDAASLGAKDAGFAIPETLAVGKGGYALELPPSWLAREREALAPLISRVDVVICSALVPGAVAPMLVTHDMVRSMRPGSVIVDVSIDQGGNCEVTQAGAYIVLYNVTVSGIQNIPGRMPEHATWLYAENLYRYVENLLKHGGVVDLSDEVVANTLVTRDRKIHYKPALDAMREAG